MFKNSRFCNGNKSIAYCFLLWYFLTLNPMRTRYISFLHFGFLFFVSEYIQYPVLVIQTLLLIGYFFVFSFLFLVVKISFHLFYSASLIGYVAYVSYTSLYLFIKGIKFLVSVGFVKIPVCITYSSLTLIWRLYHGLKTPV